MQSPPTIYFAQFQKAEPGKRLLASILDFFVSLLWALPGGAVALIGFLKQASYREYRWRSDYGDMEWLSDKADLWGWIGIAGVVVASLSYLTYFFIKDGLHGGRSTGKMVMGLYVVNAKTGIASNFGSSFLRNFTFFGELLFSVLYGAGTVVYIVECVQVLYHKDGQRLGDRLANTLVVERI